MLKWFKSSTIDVGTPAEAINSPTPRPPWIQKITVDAPAQLKQSEKEWESRLGAKLREIRANSTEDLPANVPVGVAASCSNASAAGPVTSSSIADAPAPAHHFAFHLSPLHSQLSANGSPASWSSEPGTRPQAEADREFHSETVAEPARNFDYRLTEKPAATTPGSPYTLTYSTADYGGGDPFDLESLFEDPGNPSQSWSAPEETMEELIGESSEAPATSPSEAAPAPLAPAKPRAKKSFTEKVADIFLEPSVDEADSLPAEPEITPAATERRALPSANHRASVTPVLQVNRQREIFFPLLKSQKGAMEFTNSAEGQHVILKLEETLEQFSIEGKVVGYQRGPIITRYELKIAAGTKVSRILALTDELAMALEAMRVRIEAPIPGRSTVGIEIPNKQRVKVLLGDILSDVGYKEFGGELPLPLGRDIAGNLLLEDLTRMPHLLIAGATGSGKSVAVNSFISSLILNKTPEEVRFLLVDPKLVELSAYNDIPHLLHPVITEPNKAILALNWAVEEMERRYEDLADMRARDIRSFNEKVRALKDRSEYPPMPYIVVLIDELGDLMMVAGKEVESSIIRLAQKARAVGVHLILATQRPSVDVITALIKANCPARIALQVAQKTDSRTILDGNGAEQLLGQGDMLFRHPSKGQLIRAQVPLIEDNEVEDVVRYAKKLAKPAYITLEDPKGKMGELEDGDEELFDEAWQIIMESQKASASYLQRRLRIGYNKAARLIEAFEARGMIGPQIGSKPREIISGTGQGVDRPRF